jgi:hypothetical protein
VDDDDTATANDEAAGNDGDGESWLGVQARLLLLEDGS